MSIAKALPQNANKLNGGGRLGLALVASLLLSSLFSATSAQTVHEVTIATPDVIAVEVRDPPFLVGSIEKLAAPSHQEIGAWVNVGGRWGRVIGPDRSHVRISDTPPGRYLEIDLLKNPAAFPEISGLKISAVYRKSVPYDSGIYRGAAAETMTGASLKHYIYLKLSSPLREGHHVIRWPNGILPDTPFNYESRGTRAIAIRANQHGYGPSDEAKVAYLALWLPGGDGEGAVDFGAYGLKSFEILDAQGATQFTSGISLRMAPAAPEAGNGLPSPLLEYPSATQSAIRIESLTQQPITMRAPRHGFSTGQRVWLDGFAGQARSMNGFATVRVISENSFEITDGPTGNSAPNSAGPPVVVPVHSANRAGTYVFQLDFSSWKSAKPGTYRIHIPSLGVSDPFEIADDIWLKAGRMSIGGLYNHRSGIALDGRFGFSRPASFKPGTSITIYQSKLPLSWSTYTDSGFIPAQDGGVAPWITNSFAPETYWGGHMDAGDWDRLIRHIGVNNLLLDVYESAPSIMQGVALGIPKSSEVLDRNLYADIDDVPDILHEVIWSLDFYRRLQQPHGGVSGGIESAGHPVLGVPSFLEHLRVFAYAPDHISTYQYAASAAKLARHLDRLKKHHIAQVYTRSAHNAWAFAERVYRDPDSYYAETRALSTESGAFAQTPWEARADKLRQAALEHRVAAAAAMFRLTGNVDFGRIFTEGWAGSREPYLHIADGAWEYYQAQMPGADASVQERIRQSFVSAALMVAKAQDTVSYPSMKHPYAPFGWGQGLAPDYNQAQMFIRAHQMTGDKQLLRTMQVASAHILGANQVGLSMTTGLGHRNVRHPLHEDHRAMGVKTPDGITLYGWATQAQTAHDWIFGPHWSPLPIMGTREHARYRRVEPNRFAMPVYEYFIEHPGIVSQQEYTVIQPIGTTAAIWLYLHAQSELAKNGFSPSR